MHNHSEQYWQVKMMLCQAVHFMKENQVTYGSLYWCYYKPIYVLLTKISITGLPNVCLPAYSFLRYKNLQQSLFCLLLSLILLQLQNCIPTKYNNRYSIVTDTTILYWLPFLPSSMFGILCILFTHQIRRDSVQPTV